MNITESNVYIVSSGASAICFLFIATWGCSVEHPKKGSSAKSVQGQVMLLLY